jgi:2-keto-4-pentenoate hydratase/2-oxohepta-3-ene-1,7-dioic acid hydratase in catechol pathway
MRIVRFKDSENTIHWGRIEADGSHRLLRGDLFDQPSLSKARRKSAKRLAPLPPVNIFCIGLNYRDHAVETDMPPPDAPVVFMKPTSSLAHPGDPILLPACCRRGPEVDFEGELAVVIGRKARDVTAAEALDHVLGYTVANDVSARRWQRHNGGQWVRGKSFDTFCPLGPALVTADEIPDPQQLSIRTWVNGELMQSGHTSDMIFPVDRLIAFLSQDTTLLPGTVILTGTPPGVGFVRQPPVFLQPGDEVVVEIEGIGRLVSPVAAA